MRGYCALIPVGSVTPYEIMIEVGIEVNQGCAPAWAVMISDATYGLDISRTALARAHEDSEIRDAIIAILSPWWEANWNNHETKNRLYTIALEALIDIIETKDESHGHES